MCFGSSRSTVALNPPMTQYESAERNGAQDQQDESPETPKDEVSVSATVYELAAAGSLNYGAVVPSNYRNTKYRRKSVTEVRREIGVRQGVYGGDKPGCDCQHPSRSSGTGTLLVVDKYGGGDRGRSEAGAEKSSDD